MKEILDALWYLVKLIMAATIFFVVFILPTIALIVFIVRGALWLKERARRRQMPLENLTESAEGISVEPTSEPVEPE
jgi:hypothetical protein